MANRSNHDSSPPYEFRLGLNLYGRVGETLLRASPARSHAEHREFPWRSIREFSSRKCWKRSLKVCIPRTRFCTSDCWKTQGEIDAMIRGDLTDDPVFGRISQLTIPDFADPQRTVQLQGARQAAAGLTLILGTGTALLAPERDVLILADLARWEVQCRQRANQIGNFPAGDRHQSAAAKYKRAFFLDWRVADRVKQALLARVDYLLDTNDPNAPKMCTGEAFRAGCDAH